MTETFDEVAYSRDIAARGAPRWLGLPLAWLLVAAGAWPHVCWAQANETLETLERVVSLEPPDYDNPAAILTVGKDGRVYLACRSRDYAGHLLRMNPDGTDRMHFQTGPAGWGNITANREGLVATTHQHFAHALRIHDAQLSERGQVDEFLNNDEVGYSSPERVEAGASGNFYAMDGSRQRILSISPTGKVVAIHSLAAVVDELQTPLSDFRVCESLQQFYVVGRTRKQVAAVHFEGERVWSQATDCRGGWDVTPDGELWALGANAQQVQRLSGQGKPLQPIELQWEELAPTAEHPVTAFQVHAESLFVKRRHPTEILQRFSRKTGQRLATLVTAHQRITVKLPASQWIAGSTVPFEIQFDSGPRVDTPQWHVWARPFGTSGFQQLSVEEGRLAVPDDWSGIYQIRITPDVTGAATDYSLDSLIEVQQPDTVGTLSIYTPRNRVYYGRGEKIPVTMLLRGPSALAPAEIDLLLQSSRGDELQRWTLACKPGSPAGCVVPAELTRKLLPGAYQLTAKLERWTVVEQPLEIGRGPEPGVSYFRMQFGDYQTQYPEADLWTAPETIADHVERATRLGVNLFVDRLGTHLHVREASNREGVADAAFERRLQENTGGTAPAKARTDTPLMQTMAAYSASGIRQMAILLYMDAGLPLGTGFDKRSAGEMGEAIHRVTEALWDFPAFRGWSWNANWWVGQRGAAAAPTAAMRRKYEKAVQQANQTGSWDPVLEEVSAIAWGHAVEAQAFFHRVLEKTEQERQAAPRVGGPLIRAAAGPYRNITVYPPLTFTHVDEVDLHYQAEQIQPPNTFPHNVDFQKRPGKRAWGHPELWNDNGTGDQIGPTLFQMMMRGADGIGCSGTIPKWDRAAEDARNGSFGIPSVFRAIHSVAETYGPWLTSLERSDRVAILVSSRMFRLDDWNGIGGRHFSRVYEAYQSCLYARHPAQILFIEDAAAEDLDQFQAILLVDEQVELEPRVRKFLMDARRQGVDVFYDGTCRLSVVRGFEKLGATFDHVDADPHVWQDDSAYWRFAGYFADNAVLLRETLDPVAESPADLDLPGVLLSELRSDDARFVWLVNNTMPDVEPGLLWRMTMGLTTRVPLRVPVNLRAEGKAVYDVFAQQPLDSDFPFIHADLRTTPARLFAILPRPLDSITLAASETVAAGETLSWKVRILDDRQQAHSASLPIVVLLRTETGEVIERHCGFTRKEAAGSFVVPLNLPGSRRSDSHLVLEVTEQITGRSASQRVRVVGSRVAESLEDSSRAATTTLDERVIRRNPERPPMDFGPRIRDAVLLSDDRTLVFTAFDWNHNLYGLDAETGEPLWRQSIGNHFAYQPEAVDAGLAVQGFDFHQPEGYHLYLLNREGEPRRRFGGYGLPGRAINWMSASLFIDRSSQFVVARDASWVVTSGNLGMAAWSSDGERRWHHPDEKGPYTLAALSNEQLAVGQNSYLRGLSPRSGEQLWSVRLSDQDLTIEQLVASQDGATLAARTTKEEHKVYLVQAGRLHSVVPVAADDLALSPDGQSLLVTSGRQLRYYTLEGGLQWVLTADDVIHFPRFRRSEGLVAFGTEIGSLYVVDRRGRILHRSDQQAWPVPCWMADGDLVVGTWLGQAKRLAGGTWQPRWQTMLEPLEAVPLPGEVPESETTAPGTLSLLREDTTPLVRITNWENAADETAPLRPNLLAQTRAVITASLGDHRLAWQHPVSELVDGATTPPADASDAPWLAWSDIQMIDSGWRGSLAVTFETFRTQIRLEGITIVEDPERPNSWTRDARLQYWDPATERWSDSQRLLSDRPGHTHWLEQPIEASRFRLVSAAGVWPVTNLRWREVVFHGEQLGASHPDVVAERPVAVLFDEDIVDLKTSFQHGHNPGFRMESSHEAYSGSHYFVFDPAQKEEAAPAFVAPFGHAIPDWDFAVVQHPQHGQYRYLQFACRALEAETKTITLQLGTHRIVIDDPPRQWKTYVVDLWKEAEGELTIQAMRPGGTGGAAAFDQILLARSAEDFPAGPDTALEAD